ncbi:NB-ARC domain-containing protein [Chamaesiphon minutus]|uniref:WD40 repeat-containing protein n=1 Tax=Chamaesiphon minutus (strain ATCC 27169 / PCC 6605) TaxID=1173020 RepID=K9UDD6_CHAP6|nr:NB-ARC domain-containing protein [Chamaesiphon minutus]AFY93127.1 WD40 repeat-containing protein [Chamaesiphon minutus PCC 6605]
MNKTASWNKDAIELRIYTSDFNLFLIDWARGEYKIKSNVLDELLDLNETIALLKIFPKVNDNEPYKKACIGFCSERALKIHVDRIRIKCCIPDSKEQRNKYKQELLTLLSNEYLKIIVSSSSYLSHKNKNQISSVETQNKSKKTDIRELGINSKDIFFGRAEQIDQLKNSVQGNTCKLIVLSGMGGIGKTALANQICESSDSKYIICRSLREMPPAIDVLSNFFDFLSDKNEGMDNLSLELIVDKIIFYISESPCLLILDNMESIMDIGEGLGEFQESYKEYQYFIDRVVTSNHNSCLLVTSRECPNIVENLDRSTYLNIALTGLDRDSAVHFVKSKGLQDSEDVIEKLVKACSYHPLILKLACGFIPGIYTNIQQLLDNQTINFSDSNEILEQHFERLSSVESTIIYWLAIARDFIPDDKLSEFIYPEERHSNIRSGLLKLNDRSLIKKDNLLPRWTLENVIMEFATEKLVRLLMADILRTIELIASNNLDNFDDLGIFNKFPLFQATASEYIKKIQIRLILQRIKGSCFKYGYHTLESWAKSIIQAQRINITNRGYAVGNVVNILIQEKQKIENSIDLSGLNIKEVDFSSADLQKVNMSNSYLDRCTFKESIFPLTSVTFIDNIKNPLLITGDDAGVISVWDINDKARICKSREHNHGVNSIIPIYSNSSDESCICHLITTGNEGKVKLWMITTQDNNLALSSIKTISNIENTEIHSSAVSNDSKLLAIGFATGLLEVWSIQDFQDINCIFRENVNSGVSLSALAFDNSSDLLLISRNDKEIKILNLVDRQCHSSDFTGEIYSCLKFDRENRLIATSTKGSLSIAAIQDKSLTILHHQPNVTRNKVPLENLNIYYDAGGALYIFASSSIGQDTTSKMYTFKIEGEDNNSLSINQINSFNAERSTINALCISSEMKLLSSVRRDCVVQLWDINDVENSKCIHSIYGYSGYINRVVFDPNNNNYILSSSNENDIRRWRVDSDEPYFDESESISGHLREVIPIIFSNDGEFFASGSDDNDVIFRKASNFTSIRKLTGHNNRVCSIAFATHQKILATGSYDRSFKIWSLESLECIETKTEQKARIYALAFNPHSKYNHLASGGSNGTICIWDSNSFVRIHLMEGSSFITGLSFSNDGKLLVSGHGDSRYIRLWNIENNYELIREFKAHDGIVYSVVFNHDSSILATGGGDALIKLWDVRDKDNIKPIGKPLEGHSSWVHSVAFNATGTRLISGSGDNTIVLWNIENLEQPFLIKSQRAYSPYDGLNIRDVRNLRGTQRENLKNLGAVES